MDTSSFSMIRKLVADDRVETLTAVTIMARAESRRLVLDDGRRRPTARCPYRRPKHPYPHRPRRPVIRIPRRPPSRFRAWSLHPLALRVSILIFIIAYHY